MIETAEGTIQEVSISCGKVARQTERFVIWDRHADYHKLVMLVGYCPQSVESYVGLYNDAKKAVPEVDAKETICTIVRGSRCRRGFTMLILNITGAERRTIEGFEEIDSLQDIDVAY